MDLSQTSRLLLRPPPWLALPPLLAISRCFSGLIAAKPRFTPELALFVGMLVSAAFSDCAAERIGRLAVHVLDRN
jgi:hypothetical protein